MEILMALSRVVTGEKQCLLTTGWWAAAARQYVVSACVFKFGICKDSITAQVTGKAGKRGVVLGLENSKKEIIPSQMEV